MKNINITNSKNYKYIVVLFLLIIFLEINLLFGNINARKETIPGFSTQDKVNANERVSYNFLNNITFEIATNTPIDLFIEYENTITYRQTLFILSNSEPLSLNISTKSNLQNFGVSQSPRQPQKSNYSLKYRYECIFRINSNISIEELTIRFKENEQFGLDPERSYSVGILKSNEEEWQLIDTTVRFNETTSEEHLESTLTSIQPDTDYYITIFEIQIIQEDWTWLIVTITVIAIAIGALVILISKKDYFQYLRKRTVPIEKGAHRLSLDEVLENENRNKIIDLILNEPGIHFNELLRKTGLAAGNLVWHLDILLTYKVIGKKRIGNFIAYFPYYQKNPVSNIDLKLQKSKLTLEILEIIEKNPGIWNNLITKKYKVDHKTIQYHLDKLNELGLIKFKKDGRKKKIFPNLEADYFNQAE